MFRFSHSWRAHRGYLSFWTVLSAHITTCGSFDFTPLHFQLPRLLALFCIWNSSSHLFPLKFSVWVFWWFRILLLSCLAFCLFAFFSTNFIARPSKYFPALLHVHKIVWCNSVLVRQRLVWNCMGLIKARNMYFLGIRAFLKRTKYALNGHKIKLVINLTKRAPLPNS